MYEDYMDWFQPKKMKKKLIVPQQCLKLIAVLYDTKEWVRILSLSKQRPERPCWKKELKKRVLAIGQKGLKLTPERLFLSFNEREGLRSEKYDKKNCGERLLCSSDLFIILMFYSVFILTAWGIGIV